jgi:hypothetical protein
VHLQIWVRVTPGWYEKDSTLRDMGYEPPGHDRQEREQRDARVERDPTDTKSETT